MSPERESANAETMTSSPTKRSTAAPTHAAGGIFSTLTHAAASVWGWGSGASTSKAAQATAPAPAPASPGHRNNVPGGWATGYFTVKPGGAASSPDTERTGRDTGIPPQIKVRSSGASRKRTAIPFERSPSHSRGNSDASARLLPSPTWPDATSTTPSPLIQPVSTTAASSSSSASSPRHHPSRNLASDSAMATLSRLKAQTSLSSLKSNSFDNSFATVHSHLSSSAAANNGNSVDDAESPLSPSTSASASPQARFRTIMTPPSPVVPPTSVKPGMPAPKDWKEAMARTELFDAYVHEIVYQSGIDSQGRPIILLSSAALPNPKQVDYDVLLTRIMDHMELFVQNDYTVIFFAGGSTYRPPWSWIWAAWRRLSRPFRKNCRRLYICHPTFFTRSLVHIVSTGSAFLSPKFARKITQVNTLSDLAQYIDLTQVDVPPSVLKYNMKFEKEVKIPPGGPRLADAADGDAAPADTTTAEQSQMFGVPIQSLMGQRGERGGIPRVLKDCVEELQRVESTTGISNLEAEGVFRKSPSSALLQAAQQAYNRGAPVSLKQYEDPNIAASLLKLFFRNLPDPIFPAATYPIIRACPSLLAEAGDSDGISEGVDYIKATLLPALEPPSKVIVLAYILELLHKVSLHSETNKMDAGNLATVWSPNLVKSNDPMKDIAICTVAGAATMGTSLPASPMVGMAAGPSHAAPAMRPTSLGTIIKVCIERYYEIFEFDYLDYEPPTYQPAVDGHSSEISLDQPSTPQRRRLSKSSAVKGEVKTTFGPASPGSMGIGSNPGSPSGRSVSVPRPVRSPTVHSRDGHSIQSGFGLGYGTPSSVRGLGSATTVGRSASGSLRLTKVRLGSGALAAGSASGDSGFGPASSSGLSGFLKSGSTIGGTTDSLASSAVGGTTSGVALTGANALGFFTGFGGSSVDSAAAPELKRSNTVPLGPGPVAGPTTQRSRSSSNASSVEIHPSPSPSHSRTPSEGPGSSVVSLNVGGADTTGTTSSSLDTTGTNATGPSSSCSSSSPASQASSSLGKKRSSGALKASASKSGGRPLSELKEDGDE